MAFGMVRITPRQIRKVANELVRLEVISGRLFSAKRLRVQCSDCEKPAVCYDHRDYTKPLDLEPVCVSCNWKRGQGYPRLDGPEIIEVDWHPGDPSLWLFEFLFPPKALQ